ncbi:hypothetical protein [Polaromonas hydrogenivorans]|uniref:Uncharacterized protein n=1 Tax=Polaromonas hydrogenivorans TaxID=335476 RepID=A0AAU7M1X7_9BURK
MDFIDVGSGIGRWHRPSLTVEIDGHVMAMQYLQARNATAVDRSGH